MFHNIPDLILQRMHELETRDRPFRPDPQGSHDGEPEPQETGAVHEAL